MKELQPSAVYYIKLGSKGDWEEECILKKQTIRLGFREADHSSCLRGEWDEVRKGYSQTKTAGKSTEYANQIRLFYERDAQTLWITFHAHQMWWCFANPKVVRRPDGTKVRKVIDRWRNTDILGQPLMLDSLNGDLLQVRGFRGTICRIKEHQYAIDRINGKRSPMVDEAIAAKCGLEKSLVPLIKKLRPGDFEILVDLVFSQAGWQRVGLVGKTEKDWDLDLMSPVTGERALIQVKSHSDAKEFQAYVEKFRGTKLDRLFFIVHSMSGKPPASVPSVNFIGPEQLAQLVVNAGLSSWLIKKNS